MHATAFKKNRKWSDLFGAGMCVQRWSFQQYMSNAQQRSKFWCFTVNNYTPTELAHLTSLGEQLRAITFICWGKEVGESGTPHLQGYVELAARTRINAVKVVLGTNRVHLERRRGSPSEAKSYCEKDGDFTEFGEVSKGRGRRTDLEDIRTAIKEGKKEVEIADEHFSQWVQYRRSFEAYRALCTPPLDRASLRVTLLIGESGAGKSSFVNNRFPDCWITGDPVLKWFDGYAGESVVCIDDFSGESPFRWLLRVLDIYRLRVPIKGGFVAWNPTRIFITSNKEIDEWYGGERDMAPIRRRIHDVVHVGERLGSTIDERHIAIAEYLNE